MTAFVATWRFGLLSVCCLLASCAPMAPVSTAAPDRECLRPLSFPAELTVARSSLEKGDYSTALVELRDSTVAGRERTEVQYLIGRLHEEGLGVESDKALAAAAYRASIKSSAHAKSLFRLARLTYEGIHVPSTDRERWQAREWSRRSIRSLRWLAEAGDSEAQYMVGYAFAWGFGATSDDLEAVRWLQRAAAQDHAEAQFALALLYSGEIAWGYQEHDKEAALRWLRLAAESGYRKAQHKLGEWYRWGVAGLPQDDILAYKWFSFAVARGSEGASTDRDNLAATMSIEDLAKARQATRQKCF